MTTHCALTPLWFQALLCLRASAYIILPTALENGLMFLIRQLKKWRPEGLCDWPGSHSSKVAPGFPPRLSEPRPLPSPRARPPLRVEACIPSIELVKKAGPLFTRPATIHTTLALSCISSGPLDNTKALCLSPFYRGES